MEPMDELDPDDPQSRDPRRAALLGLILILLLVGGGLYLAHVLHDASRIQDCVMSGRTNCAPIEARHSSPEESGAAATPSNKGTGAARADADCARRCRDRDDTRSRQ
jgi:hypothetical protein